MLAVFLITFFSLLKESAQLHINPTSSLVKIICGFFSFTETGGIVPSFTALKIFDAFSAFLSSL